jgi:magnesium chelatase family protein
LLRRRWQHWLFFAQPQEAAFSSNNGVFMSLALVHSRAQVGVQAPAVSVETDLANGLSGKLRPVQSGGGSRFSK